MSEELDVYKMVTCPEDERLVSIDDECAFCKFYNGMGDLNFTMNCGFPDTPNEDHKGDDPE